MKKNLDLTYTPQQIEVFFNSGDYRFIVVPKGRRFGATQGAIHAAIEWSISGEPVLWGDTINSNIDRYFERYAKPVLRNAEISYNYNVQQKKLTYEDSPGFIDFRSADRPENWEGFGYKRIILNEAGIILKNEYLYTNAVLPMLMDFPDSRLYALGVPKGKKGKDKKSDHPFWTLYKNAKNNLPGYVVYEYSSYDNPLLSAADIEMLEKEIRRMNPAMVDQEIYGKFVDGATGTMWTPDMIHHADHIPELVKIGVAVDPSGSKEGDEVGIVSGGVSKTGDVYILSDVSKQSSPREWALLCTNEYQRLRANAIIAEKNYGGQMVRYTINTIDRNAKVIEVNASRGKDIRAEPIVGKYEDGKVFHAKGLHGLENEMLTWVPGVGKSPNRVDALVWLITYLTNMTVTNEGFSASPL